MKYKTTVGCVISEFNRRKITPDVESQVKQGHLRLWYYCNRYIAELYLDSADGRLAPGTIMLCGGPYQNTTPLQEIANDIMSQIKPAELAQIYATPPQQEVE
jgi:hypothetical protein